MIFSWAGSFCLQSYRELERMALDLFRYGFSFCFYEEEVRQRGYCPDNQGNALIALMFICRRRSLLAMPHQIPHLEAGAGAGMVVRRV